MHLVFFLLKVSIFQTCDKYRERFEGRADQGFTAGDQSPQKQTQELRIEEEEEERLGKANLIYISTISISSFNFSNWSF